MELSYVLISCIVIQGSLISAKSSAESVFSILSRTKTELAQSHFKKELKEKDKPKIVNLTHTTIEELNMSTPMENVRIFRNAKDQFLFNGVDLLQLQKNGTSKNRYSLAAVDDIRLDEGAAFFKNAEWQNKIFLVVCYQKGYCEVRMSSATTKVNLKMKINTGTLPLDVNLFGTKEDFFLITVQDPVTVYRWTGTYFNEDYHLETTGAQSVAVFEDKGKSVIIVAQNLGRSMVYSKVYIRTNNGIELFQLLPTNQPLKVFPFNLIHENDSHYFVFILNNVESSSIFWWTGREFILWKSLDNIYGQRVIYVGNVDAEVFFFVADENKIYVYRPTVTSFDLMQIITFDQEVVGIDLKMEKDQMPMLMILTGSASDPYFKVNLIYLQVNYLPSSDEKPKNSDKIFQCLSNLNRKLRGRGEKIQEVYEKAFGESRPSKVSIQNLKVASLECSVKDLDEKVKKVKNGLKNIRNETKNGRKLQYHVYGDFKIDRMAASIVNVEILNGNIVDFGQFLSVAKSQTIRGPVNLKTLSVDNLRCTSVNEILVEDMLVRNRSVQKVFGEYIFASLASKNVKMGSAGTLNKIIFNNIVTNQNSKDVVKGRKIFHKMKTKQMKAENINNVLSRNWLIDILPPPNTADKEEALNFTSLSIKKLWISNINGIFWDDFLVSVVLPLYNETIKGNLKIEGSTATRNLKTIKINEVSTEKLFEKAAPSNLTCSTKPPKKSVKSLPLQLAPIWDDSFIKEILNDPQFPFDGDVEYFPKAEVPGNLQAFSVFFKNPFDLSIVAVDSPENFKDRFWMKTQNQAIAVPVILLKDTFVVNSLSVNKVNNRTLNSFLWTDRSNFAVSELVFQDISFEKNVKMGENIKQYVNLANLNSSSIKCGGKNVILGQKRFMKSLSAKNLHVDFLNNIDLKHFKKLIKNKIKTDEIEISELVVFGDVKVQNDVQVKTINDGDFNYTISRALTWNDPSLLEKAHFLSLTVKNMDVDFINNIEIEDKLPKLSKTSIRDVNVVVEGNFVIPKINATKVNGISFDKYINQVNKKVNIKGEKIFKEMVHVTGNLKGNLNEYKVRELEKNALSKTKRQVITGIYVLEEFNANELEAEIVDGVPTRHLLYQDTPSTQIINSKVVFHNMAIAGDVKALNFMKDCDLRKVTDINFKNLANFETVEVKGNLTWNSTREFYGLSNFLVNVVTKSGVQSISSPVTLENDVTLEKVSGERHFGDVNIRFISSDAIYKSLQKQDIATPLTFKNCLKCNGVKIGNNVLLDSINGIDVTEFEEKLVRKSIDSFVKGKKIFKAGFTSNHLNTDIINEKYINDIVFYDNVQEYKEIKLPTTTFSHLNIFNDLEVRRVNERQLDLVLDKKISKTKNQSIHGVIVTKGNVALRGKGRIQRINDVNVKETILTDEEGSSKVITGDIEFRDTISIADNLEVEYINGHNMMAALEKALTIDEDVVIDGNVVFASNLTVDGNIKFSGNVSGCDLQKVTKMDFENVSNEINDKIRKTLNKKVAELKNATDVKNNPVIFMYLKEMAKLDLQLPNIHGSAINEYKDFVEFNIYGMNHGNCGLPTECYCPTQTNLKIRSMNPVSLEIKPNSTRYFKFYDEDLGVELKVTTDTVSYSSRCKKINDGVVGESTTLSWRKSEKNSPEILVRKIFKGFLSDVKFFKLADSVYVVMAFYFHPSRNQTNNLHTIVYELNVSRKKVEKVDVIPSNGAQVLEVFWTTRGVILVIGNSFDSDLFTDSVNSAIYRFNEFKNKFELLRFVKTHGVLSIKSMRYKKTSFIFFVQKQTWPLLILKYNQEYDNYYFSQKLDTAQSMVRSNFLSVSIISIQNYLGDVFVGIVLSDDSFRLFKYKHIEGFVEQSYQEQNNVRILHSFWLDSTHYLLSGSASDTSKIYKFVEQGRSSNSSR